MSSEWHARIEDVRNGRRRVVGAGFLVDPRRVLTCQHVVAGCSDIRLSFVQARRRDVIDRPGRVVFSGPWRRTDDYGDVAVVELDDQVDLPPARLVTAFDADARFVAHGFPPDAGPFGSVLPLNISSADGIGEWLHIEAATGHAEFPRQGFSGAAVYDAATAEVIGMITDASASLARRTGRVLPISSVRMHWEDVDDLIDLKWLPDVGDRRRLRSVLANLRTDVALESLVMSTFPETQRPRDLFSLWDAVRYVAEELLDDDRLARFLLQVAAHLDRASQPSRPALVGWVRQTLSAAPPVGDRLSSIIVRLEPRTKGGYFLSFSTLANGVPGPSTQAVPVARDEVQAQVELMLPEMMERLVGTDPIIEFVLPQALLGEPVDEWHFDRANDIPLRYYPVVVRDVARMGPGSAVIRDQWMRRSRGLRADPRPAPGTIGCRWGTPGQVYERLMSRPEMCVLVCSSRPNERSLAKVLSSGLPVALWPRARCAATDHAHCERQMVLDKLVPRLAASSFDELPHLARDLRLEARGAKTTPHYGRRLTLMWDDPDRMPDPPTYMDG
jgi:vWA-MoxR associated protein C-terminal domain/vWA-MoxR associated protein middle region (VMAP-M) 8/Trypsin-like peptidase domain